MLARCVLTHQKLSFLLFLLLFFVSVTFLIVFYHQFSCLSIIFKMFPNTSYQNIAHKTAFSTCIHPITFVTIKLALKPRNKISKPIPTHTHTHSTKEKTREQALIVFSKQNQNPTRIYPR